MCALSSSCGTPVAGVALTVCEAVVDRNIFFTFNSTLLVRFFFIVWAVTVGMFDGTTLISVACTLGLPAMVPFRISIS